MEEEIQMTFVLLQQAAKPGSNQDENLSAYQTLQMRPTVVRDLIVIARPILVNNLPVFAIISSDPRASRLSSFLLAKFLQDNPASAESLGADLAFQAIVALVSQEERDLSNEEIANIVSLLVKKLPPLMSAVITFLHSNITQQSSLDVALIAECFAALLPGIPDESTRLNVFRELVGLIRVYFEGDDRHMAIQKAVFARMYPSNVGWRFVSDKAMLYLLFHAMQGIAVCTDRLLSDQFAEHDERRAILLAYATSCERFIADFSNAIRLKLGKADECPELLELMAKHFEWASGKLIQLRALWQPYHFPDHTLQSFCDFLEIIIKHGQLQPDVFRQTYEIARIYGEYYDDLTFHHNPSVFWAEAYEYGSRSVPARIYRLLLREDPERVLELLLATLAKIVWPDEAVVYFVVVGMDDIEEFENEQAQEKFRQLACEMLSGPIQGCKDNFMCTMFLLGARAVEFLPIETAERWKGEAFRVIKELDDCRRRGHHPPGSDVIRASAAFEYLCEWFDDSERTIPDELVEVILWFNDQCNPPTSKHLNLIEYSCNQECARQLLQKTVMPKIDSCFGQNKSLLAEGVVQYLGILDGLVRSAGDMDHGQMLQLFEKLAHEQHLVVEFCSLMSAISDIVDDVAVLERYLSIFYENVHVSIAHGIEISDCLGCILRKWWCHHDAKAMIFTIIFKVIEHGRQDGYIDATNFVPVATILCQLLLSCEFESPKATGDGMYWLQGVLWKALTDDEDVRPLACLSLMEVSIVSYLCDFDFDLNILTEMIEYCYGNNLFVTNYHRYLLNLFEETFWDPPEKLAMIFEHMWQNPTILNDQAFCSIFAEYLTPAMEWEPTMRLQ